MASFDQVWSWEYILVVLSVQLLQRHLRLWRSMWEKKSLPHKSHLCVVSGLLELLRSFLLLHSPAFPVSWGVGLGCFTSCGWLQGPPRTRCWYQVLSCLSCTHPCSAAVGSLWISFQMPTLHRECLLGCSHPPCGRHAPANKMLKCTSSPPSFPPSCPCTEKPPAYHTVKSIVETVLRVALMVTDAVLEQLPAVFAVHHLRAALPGTHAVWTLQAVKVALLCVAFLLEKYTAMPISLNSNINNDNNRNSKQRKISRIAMCYYSIYE